ncbi:MAG TPA: glycosyltransferase family 25 protein [Anaeromyxobacter sp.]
MHGAFEFLNGWADRVLVVSLARATDRQARLRERLGGLRYELFPATDKLELDRERLLRDGSYDESRTRRAFRHTKDMNLGEIACAVSHRRAYEEAVRNGWARTVVLEDDVAPLEANLPLLPAALSQLPAGWDLCYLGYARNEAPTARDRAKRALYVALGPLRLVRWRSGEARRLLPSPFSANLRRAGQHDYTVAYAVSLGGARKLLEAQTPISLRADRLLASLVVRGRLSAFVAAPKMFDPDPSAASYVHG